MWKRAVLWVVTVLWCVVIFCFSAQPADNSNQVSVKVSEKVTHALSETDVMTKTSALTPGKIHFMVRKTAHFMLYLVLGALLMALGKSYWLPFGRSAVISVVVSVLYAAGDEWHQSFISGRSGQISDVLLDGLGAFVGILLLSIGMFYFKNKIRKK
ncbi:MAG: VanZ family protein [Clostridia bacterium]|nr:VanZ family protein [Clostridia bacterium]